MPESIADKAARLVATDCVAILVASENRVIAKVRGDHGVHDVQGRADGAGDFESTGSVLGTAEGIRPWAAGTWSCTCPARRPCSHVRAVQLANTGES